MKSREEKRKDFGRFLGPAGLVRTNERKFVRIFVRKFKKIRKFVRIFSVLRVSVSFAGCRCSHAAAFPPHFVPDAISSPPSSMRGLDTVARASHVRTTCFTSEARKHVRTCFTRPWPFHTSLKHVRTCFTRPWLHTSLKHFRNLRSRHWTAGFPRSRRPSRPARSATENSREFQRVPEKLRTSSFGYWWAGRRRPGSCSPLPPHPFCLTAQMLTFQFINKHIRKKHIDISSPSFVFVAFSFAPRRDCQCTDPRSCRSACGLFASQGRIDIGVSHTFRGLNVIEDFLLHRACARRLRFIPTPDLRRAATLSHSF